MLALLLFALVPAAQERLAHEPGDHCLLCGRETTEGELVELHRGRRVAVCADCEEPWAEEKHVYFSRLQPKSALFQEAEEDRGPLSDPWFWVGVWMVAGLVSSAGAAYLAVNRGQPPVAWFFAGLVGNVAALAVLVFIIPRGDLATLPAGVPAGLAKVPVTREARVCTHCGASMHPSAGACSACGTAVEPLVESEVQRARGGN